MATRKPSDTVQPDIDDIDGQNGTTGIEAISDGGTDSDGRTIDGKPVTSIDGIAGDNYARDGDGNILRNKDGSPRKKRGRRAGNSNGNGGKSRAGSNQTLSNSINTLSQTLLIMHQGLANFMKFEDMALSEDESKALAMATVNVMDQFDFVPDPKITAVVGLVTTATTIYGPRIYLYKQHKEKERKERKQEKADILPFSVTGQNG